MNYNTKDEHIVHTQNHIRTMHESELYYDIAFHSYLHAVLCYTDCWPNQPKNLKKKPWSISLEFACLLIAFLETVQSVASSVILYQLLKSGDVEQNPGPGI